MDSREREKRSGVSCHVVWSYACRLGGRERRFETTLRHTLVLKFLTVDEGGREVCVAGIQ